MEVNELQKCMMCELVYTFMNERMAVNVKSALHHRFMVNPDYLQSKLELNSEGNRVTITLARECSKNTVELMLGETLAFACYQKQYD